MGCAMNAPNTQGWALVGLFSLTFFIFSIVACHLDIQAMQQLFVVLATAIVSGGLCGALGFYFGSSKGSQAKDDAIAAMVPGKDASK